MLMNTKSQSPLPFLLVAFALVALPPALELFAQYRLQRRHAIILDVTTERDGNAIIVQAPDTLAHVKSLPAFLQISPKQ